MILDRLHHVTCVCSDAQQTTDFYRDQLGFTLAKKTVNFDDPHSYHLYFGDEIGLARQPDDVLRVAARRARAARARDARVDRARHAVGERRDRDRRILTACACGSTRVTGLRCTTSSRIGNPDLYAGLVDEDAPI